MLVHEIVSDVHGLAEDPDYWTSARLKVLINRCQRQMVGYFGILCTAYKQMVSVVGQQNYMLPYDFVEMHMLYYDGNGPYILDRVTTPKEVYSVVSDPTEQGIPNRYFLWGVEDREEMWIYPTFSSEYTVELFYWRRPPDIANDNDEPMVPREFHHFMVDYCERFIWMKDEEHNFNPERFDQWWTSTLMQMQLTENMKRTAGDNIKFGNFDDKFPRRATGISGMKFNTGDGVIWG